MSGAKLWVTSPIVTVADFGGGDGVSTGQTIVNSNQITLDIPTMPVADWTIEIEMDLIRQNIGGIARCYSWVRYWGITDIVPSASTVEALKYTPMLFSEATLVGISSKRIIRIKPSVFQARQSSLLNRIEFNIAGKGHQDIDVWVIKNIKARLLYIPVA